MMLFSKSAMGKKCQNVLKQKLQYILCARYDLDLVGGFSSDLRATSLGIAFELFLFW